MKNKFLLTENAIKRINLLASKENNGAMLRIEVEAGGCSGFQYKFNFEAESSKPNDLIIEQDGALVVIDNISFNFLDGAKLDFIENLGESYFEIKNPNATSGCGCGNSFSI